MSDGNGPEMLTRVDGPGDPDVLTVTVDEVGVCTMELNRPDKRNALNEDLVAALHDAIGDAAVDPHVRVIVIRGAGNDFCSGADLAALEKIAEMGAEESLTDAQLMGDLFVGIRTVEKLIVAAVHGRALAGGAGLATACDLVLASESAEFGYPEVHLGFVPAMVMAILRRKLGESRAFELVARGHRINAVEAERIGLVNRVFPDATFEADVDAYLADLAKRPASAIALSKRLFYGLDGMSFDEGVARGAEVNAIARLTEACREGVRRFLAKAKG